MVTKRSIRIADSSPTFSSFKVTLTLVIASTSMEVYVTPDLGEGGVEGKKSGRERERRGRGR